MVEGQIKEINEGKEEVNVWNKGSGREYEVKGVKKEKKWKKKRGKGSEMREEEKEENKKKE